MLTFFRDLLEVQRVEGYPDIFFDKFLKDRWIEGYY